MQGRPATHRGWDDVRMNGSTARKALQVFLSLLGAVALIAGVATVLRGTNAIVGAEDVSGTVDSEMRFFAVWYAAAGVVLLRAVPRVESERVTIKAVALLFFVAGCARGLSWLAVGRPHMTAVVLMSIELALPFLILPLQAIADRPHRSR